MRAPALILALVAALLGAGSAQAETSIYVAEQPGFSITLKAKGRRVFVTTLRDTGYCRGTGAHRDEITEGKGESFLGGPAELERTGSHLHYSEKVTETFYSRTVLNATLRPDAIVGTYLSESSSPVEGDGGCQTGTPDGDPRVYFTAKRYVPLGSELAVPPDPAAPAIYLANTRTIEMYLWVDGGAVTDVRGTIVETCLRPHHRPYRSRGHFLLYPPFALSPSDGSFSTEAHYDSSAIRRAVYLSGMVADAETAGLLRETYEARERGRLEERCGTGTAKRGWVPYRAIRFVPVA
jgi:hypothetical protein